MRTTITIDDELMDRALAYSDVKEKSALIEAALKAFVELEASRRLALLGGTQKKLRPIPRRRPSL
ncbi:MAG TPA: type II toxin-antitoxin system VapB family antitoxin [Rhizomicrobium sp.]|jgi:Arc/MetJ family transcription regulator